MSLWIKIAIVVVGVVLVTAVHFFFKGKPEDQAIETVIEEIVNKTSGIDITTAENDIENVMDNVDGSDSSQDNNNKN